MIASNLQAHLITVVCYASSDLAILPLEQITNTYTHTHEIYDQIFGKRVKRIAMHNSLSIEAMSHECRDFWRCEGISALTGPELWHSSPSVLPECMPEQNGGKGRCCRWDDWVQQICQQLSYQSRQSRKVFEISNLELFLNDQRS